MLRGEPELLVQLYVGSGCPEVLQADALTEVAGEHVPRLRDAGLDADARPDVRGQYLLLIGSILPGKPFHARHGNNACRDPLVLEKVPPPRRYLRPPARRDRDPRRLPARPFGEDVPATGHPIRARQAFALRAVQ